MESRQEVLPQPIEPLPYFPKLCRVLGGVTISIVLVYLEIHHSPPEPDPDAQPARTGLRTPPVSLDCDQACEDLGVSRRTLDTALKGIAVWWKTEEARSAAARSSREFLKTSGSFVVLKRAGIRPYAIVGSGAYQHPRTIAIHRNTQRLDQIAIEAGIAPSSTKDSEWTAESETCDPLSSVRSVPGLLENVLELGAKRSGIAWGWTDERRRLTSERMTERWAKYHKSAHNDAVGGP